MCRAGFAGGGAGGGRAVEERASLLRITHLVPVVVIVSVFLLHLEGSRRRPCSPGAPNARSTSTVCILDIHVSTPTHAENHSCAFHAIRRGLGFGKRILPPPAAGRSDVLHLDLKLRRAR